MTALCLEMSIENVKTYLASKGLADRYIEFPGSSATVALAAEQLGCEPDRIAKTLAIKLKSGRLIAVVVSGESRLDNSKFKKLFKETSHFCPADELETLFGHPMGGVCPFALKENVEIYLDESAGWDVNSLLVLENDVFLQIHQRICPVLGIVYGLLDALVTENMFELLQIDGWCLPLRPVPCVRDGGVFVLHDHNRRCVNSRDATGRCPSICIGSCRNLLECTYDECRSCSDGYVAVARSFE